MLTKPGALALSLLLYEAFIKQKQPILQTIVAAVLAERLTHTASGRFQFATRLIRARFVENDFDLLLSLPAADVRPQFLRGFAD